MSDIYVSIASIQFTDNFYENCYLSSNSHCMSIILKDILKP